MRETHTQLFVEAEEFKKITGTQAQELKQKALEDQKSGNCYTFYLA
jgi:hypothetical protein